MAAIDALKNLNVSIEGIPLTLSGPPGSGAPPLSPTEPQPQAEPAAPAAAVAAAAAAPAAVAAAAAPLAATAPAGLTPPAAPTEADRINAVREGARAGLPGASGEGAGVRAKGAIPTLDTYWCVRTREHGTSPLPVTSILLFTFASGGISCRSQLIHSPAR